MICFKDMTFCSFNKCNKWGVCPRSLTDEIKDQAIKWWIRGGGEREETPISQFTEPPECYSEME